MLKLMSPWILFILLPSIYAIGNPRYECGEHGRFEYCIDGFPDGCIVGCHCHPGYYFDTETKICEPNAKLVEEYRRLYVAEPTRVPSTQSPDFSESGPTPTTTTATDGVTRDTDDLGDWLYNQFFKTIETQVINNTDKSNVLTRRTGSDPIKKPKRLRKYKTSKSSKKAKKKNDDLRRKLLRITEDDSLFDSTFDSDSEESSSESESISIENTSSRGCKDHEQRKLILFNKKPKMPLPSFVFLPNYQTPFYPPLGLPPPPPMPMYPMIPVPPMPAFPCPESTTQSTTKSDDHTTKDNDKKDDGKKHDKEKKHDNGKKEDVNNKNKENENNTTDDDDEKEETDKKKVIEKSDENKSVAGNDTKIIDETQNITSNSNSSSFLRSRSDIEHGNRKQFLQKLRERMRPPNMKLNMSPNRHKKKKMIKNHFIDMNQEPVMDMPFGDDYMEPLVLDEATAKPMDEPPVPAENDVDFKYLAQLIHRVDPNLLNSEDLIKNKMQMLERRNQLVPINRPTRRFNGNRFLTRPNEPDDSYYSNMGQQIAALIRRLDSEGHRHVDIEVDPKQKAPAHPVFNENNFAARSYWERSVRSPFENNPTYTDEDYPQTMYRNLFNLENKVENVATTARTFSLNDLENVVYLMDRAKLSLKDKSMVTTKLSKGNLNVNLLPRQKERFENTRRHNVMKMKDSIDRNDAKSKNTTRIRDKNIKTPLTNLHGVLMNNFKHIVPDSTLDLFMSTFGKIPPHQKIQNQTINIGNNNALAQESNILTKNMNYINQPPNESMHSSVADIYKSHLNKYKPMSLVYHLAPIQQHSFNARYYHDENKNYMKEKESIPFQVTSDEPYLKPSKPSYFHHELHHFDYFD